MNFLYISTTTTTSNSSVFLFCSFYKTPPSLQYSFSNSQPSLYSSSSNSQPSINNSSSKSSPSYCSSSNSPPSTAPPPIFHPPNALSPILHPPFIAPPPIFHPLSNASPSILHFPPFIAHPPTSQLQSNISTHTSSSGTFLVRGCRPSRKPPVILSYHSHQYHPMHHPPLSSLRQHFPPTNTNLHSYSHSQKPPLPPSPPVNQLSPKYVTPQKPFPFSQIVHHPPYLQGLMNNLAVANSIKSTLLSFKSSSSKSYTSIPEVFYLN